MTHNPQPTPDTAPAEIISDAVGLYHRFSLSLRDVELMLPNKLIVSKRSALTP